MLPQPFVPGGGGGGGGVAGGGGGGASLEGAGGGGGSSVTPAGGLVETGACPTSFVRLSFVAEPAQPVVTGPRFTG
jgi:hypothetical protein